MPTAIAARPSQRPWLLLLLDGVAYERVRGLYGAGGFRRFRRPARLISVFPTLTDPAYDVLFGSGPTPGYEAGYFDRAAGRLTNGFTSYLRGKNEAWVRQVDYRVSFFKDAIMYLFPRRVYRSELRQARRVLDASLAAGRAQVVLYILSTDGLGHMLPPAEIDAELARLDEWVQGVLRDYGGDLEVVVLSDHGLAPLPAGLDHLSCFDLARVLKAAGLRIARRLQRTGDVVVPLFGLLDVARLHMYDEQTSARALDALRARAEVELVAVRDNGRVLVYSQTATAIIRRREGPEVLYSYECDDGDPLQLAPACAALKAARQFAGDGFATASAWLAASAELPFPAAPQRLWDGLFVLSREQPDVVVSLADGWYVGSGLLSRFVRLQGTHGGLHRRASETFVMSTCADVPSPIDLSGVAAWLRSRFGWRV